ncbi:hypothetical protein, partial [Tabrizicola sp.]|uniref:hypothetical protein n=1 Tax=Tabrizicola sp. TaxID=2005166 RepID=UPI00286CEAFF
VAGGAQTVTVRVVLEPAAQAALQERGEFIMLAAYWEGEPAPGHGDKADERGRIYLTSEEYTVFPVEQTFVLGQTLAAAPLTTVIEPLVNVNVFTARVSDENNLIDCGLVDGPLSEFAGKEAVMTCKLIQ